MRDKVKVRHAGVFRLGAGAMLLAAAIALVPAGPLAFAGSAPAWKVEPLASPAVAGSSEPRMTEQGNRVVLSWLEVTPERTTLKFAERTSSGWSAPRTVYASDLFFVNAFDIPSVRRLANGTIVANWTEINGPDPDASKVLFSWSNDGGQSWSKPVSPHHDGTATEHGFVSTFPTRGGGFGLVWIDGRATNPETETGDMSLRASVFSAAGKPVQAETVVDARVCECCSTAAAETSSGPIIAYRDRSAGEVRDIYVTRYADGRWTAPVDVHHDGWRIDACPINGPAVAARGNEVAVAWFMAKNNQGRAFVAFSRDGGRSFGQPVRVDDSGSLGRLGVAMLDDGSAAVSWIESASGKSLFRVRRVMPNGERGPAVTIAETSGSRYSRIARHGDELLFAWTEGDTPSRVRTARIRLGAK
jgi:hypothetical protein